MIQSADPSCRFALAADAPLLANLAALWTVNAALARTLESLDESAVYPVTPSRSGPPTVSLQTNDGRNIQLHSRHQPIEEAGRQIDRLSVSEKTFFYVLGFALGYHVQLLWERACQEAVILVIEPDPAMLLTALLHRDMSAMIESRRVLFFCTDDKSQLLALLTPYSAMVTLGPQTLTHGPSVQRFADYFAQVKIWLEEFAAFSNTSITTLVMNSAKTAQNIAANIFRYAATASLDRLKNRYAGLPAVIVSAGPSLRKNQHQLNGLSENAVIVAVQTTLQPLLQMGVEPHFVTSLDYHEICSRFFEKLPPTLRTELVAEPKATPGVFDLFPGPVTVIGNDFAESLLREMELGKPKLTAGATVAHLAFYVAEHLGCDPIIFVGQDLGFSDGLCYAPGTSYDDVWQPELSRFCTLEMKQWEQIVRERHILRRIPDQQGRPMYTEERLYTYLQQFERDFGQSKARIIDATEGGALKRGTLIMPLAQAIEQFCSQPLPVPPLDYVAQTVDLIPRCLQSLALRQEEAVRIREIAQQTLPLLEEARDCVQDQAHLNRVIAEVDVLRAQMNELGRTYDQVMQLTQETELKRFSRDRDLAASGADGVERQRRQITRDIENVQAVRDAARAFDSLVTQVMSTLSEQEEAPRGRYAA